MWHKRNKMIIFSYFIEHSLPINGVILLIHVYAPTVATWRAFQFTQCWLLLQVFTLRDFNSWHGRSNIRGSNLNPIELDPWIELDWGLQSNQFGHRTLCEHRCPTLTIWGIDQIFMIFIRVSSETWLPKVRDVVCVTLSAVEYLGALQGIVCNLR